MKRIVHYVNRKKKVIGIIAGLIVLGAFFRWEVREVNDATTGKPIERYRGIVFPWRPCGVNCYGDRLVSFHVRHWLVYGLAKIDAKGQTTYGTDGEI